MATLSVRRNTESSDARSRGPLSIPTARFALLLAAFATQVPAAPVTISFEGLPDAYFFSSGDQNIGSFYAGITFGPDVTALSVSRFGGYDNSGFPPHSGDVAIWDASDPTIDISFNSALLSFGIWYTTFDPLTLEAFGSTNNLLGTIVGDPNTDGTTGTPSFLSFSGAGIRSVTLTSTPGFFVLDDLTMNAGASTRIPEPRSVELLTTGVLLMCALYRHKKCARR